MEKARNFTMYFIIFSVILWLAYDGGVIFKFGTEASISQVLIDYFYDYPIGTFLFGVVTGHLVWQMSSFRPMRLELQRYKQKYGELDE